MKPFILSRTSGKDIATSGFDTAEAAREQLLAERFLLVAFGYVAVKTRVSRAPYRCVLYRDKTRITLAVGKMPEKLVG